MGTNIPKQPSVPKMPSYNSVKTDLDLINRQAVLDGLASIAKAKAKSDAQKAMMGRTMFFVEQLPSVSTENTGHWSRKTKVDAYDLCGVKTWGIKCQCDRCTFTTTVVEDFGYYKYCPNCGAKMQRW